MYNVRSLPEGGEHEDERTLGIANLMEFIKKANRQDTYIRYVHQLAQVHLRAKNITEAALTLLLHADLLDWSDKILIPEVGFPKQTSQARKEMLFNQIVDLLTTSKFWEHALHLSKDLALQYETRLFDYTKVFLLI